MRMLICGAGNRVFPKDPPTALFRGWFETIRRSPDWEVVGVHDIAEASLDRVRRNYALESVPTFVDFPEALRRTNPEAVLIAPAAEAHAEAALAAIAAGCHLLIEKPLATSLGDAIRIARAAQARGVVVSVVQNWRAKSMGLALQRAVASGQIGRVGNILFRYVRNREQPHLPAYLFEERYPLLYAMAIHHFDLFRFALGEKIVSVHGVGFTPPWSRYQSPPGVQLWMTTESGVAISYVGTFSSKNTHVAQESLIVEGALGSLTNDSQWGDPPLWLSGEQAREKIDLTADASRNVRDQYNEADEVYLADLHRAITSGHAPLCPADDNIWTLAAIDAAATACDTGRTIDVRRLVQESEELVEQRA